MQTRDILEQLCLAAARLGYEVRRERLAGRGGSCQLKGKKYLFVDVSLPLDEQIDQVARALAAEPDLGRLDLPPLLQQLLREFTPK